MSCRRLFVTDLVAGIIFAAFLMVPPRTVAAIGFQPVSADELKMTSEPKAPGAPAIILYRQVDREDNINTAHEDHTYESRSSPKKAATRPTCTSATFRNTRM